MRNGCAGRLSGLLLAVLIAGCGGGKGGGATTGTNPDIEAYCRHYAEHSCDASFVCSPQTARSTETDCVSDAEAACLAQAHAWQIPGVMAGRLSFDPDAAAACLAGSDQGPCGLPWPSADACAHVFVPHVPKGGACLNKGECQDGICDRTSTCPGVCAAPGQAGDDCSVRPCDKSVAKCAASSATAPSTCVGKLRGMACQSSSDCAADDFCQSQADTLPCRSSGAACACAARASAGAACALAEQCAVGLGCAGGTCRSAVSQQGEPCSYAQGVACVAGLACIITDGRRSALAGTCGPMLAADSPCFWVECQRGLDCVGSSIDDTAPVQGTCRPKAQPGQPCQPFGCTVGYDCDSATSICTARPGAGDACVAIGGGENFCFGHDLTCDHYQEGGTCTTPPASGAPCWETCAAGLHCDNNATNTCLPGQAPGAFCSYDPECASGACSLNVCAPPCSAANL